VRTFDDIFREKVKAGLQFLSRLPPPTTIGAVNQETQSGILTSFPGYKWLSVGRVTLKTKCYSV